MPSTIPWSMAILSVMVNISISVSASTRVKFKISDWAREVKQKRKETITCSILWGNNFFRLLG
jgi:hypothetical protein